jgi:hypothetical protein
LAALAGEVHPTFLAYYNAKLMSSFVFLIAFDAIYLIEVRPLFIEGVDK